MSISKPWKPTTCEAPDLLSLSSNLVAEGYMRMLFHSAESSNPKTRALRFGYLRLVDKCTYEYRNGRASLQEYVKSHEIGTLLRTASHFESCINSMKRAVNYLNALRKDQDGPTISKNISVLKNEKRIRKIRDSIEHTDKDILKQIISPGEPHVLMVTDEGLSLGGEKICWHEIAKWIEQLHVEAHKVAGHNAK